MPVNNKMGDAGGKPAQKIKENILDAFLGMDNIAEDIDDELLTEIGSKVVEEYEIDEESREDWKKQNEEAFKLVNFIREEKNHPIEN